MADALSLGSENLNPILSLELIIRREQLQLHYNRVCWGGVSTCSQGGLDNQVSHESELHVLGTTRDYCFWLPEAQFSAVQLLSKYSGLSAGHRERSCVEGMVLITVMWRGRTFGSDLIQGLIHG